MVNFERALKIRRREIRKLRERLEKQKKRIEALGHYDDDYDDDYDEN